MKKMLFNLGALILFMCCTVIHADQLELLDNSQISNSLKQILEENNFTSNELLLTYGISEDDLNELNSETKEFFDNDFKLVKIGGRINHFGKDVKTMAPLNFKQNVEGVNVWFAEYPYSRSWKIISNNNQGDEVSNWSLFILLHKNKDFDASLIFEKEGWITTKSNVLNFGNESREDYDIQYIDPDYYNQFIKPMIEGKFTTELKSAIVVTVGESWASMHCKTVPHGISGAECFLSTKNSGDIPKIEPIYFNESVIPDPNLRETSIDGGVVYLNVKQGEYSITAEKKDSKFDSVIFNITEDDFKYDVILYIASPPNSVQMIEKKVELNKNKETRKKPEMKKIEYKDATPTLIDNDVAKGISGRVVIGKEDGAENFCMRVFEVAENGHTPKHIHDWEHQIFFHSGNGEVFHDNKWHPVKAGSVVFIPGGEEHQIKNISKEPLVFVCLVPKSAPEL